MNELLAAVEALLNRWNETTAVHAEMDVVKAAYANAKSARAVNATTTTTPAE